MIRYETLKNVITRTVVGMWFTGYARVSTEEQVTQGVSLLPRRSWVGLQLLASLHRTGGAGRRLPLAAFSSAPNRL